MGHLAQDQDRTHRGTGGAAGGRSDSRDGAAGLYGDDDLDAGLGAIYNTARLSNSQAKELAQHVRALMDASRCDRQSAARAPRLEPRCINCGAVADEHTYQPVGWECKVLGPFCHNCWDPIEELVAAARSALPQELNESRSPDGDGPPTHLGLGLGEEPRTGRNTARDACVPSVRAPKDAAGSEPADSLPALPRVPEPDLLAAWREQDQALQDIYGECGEDAPIGCPGDVFALVKRTLEELRATAARVPEPDLLQIAEQMRAAANSMIRHAFVTENKDQLHAWADQLETVRAARAGAQAPRVDR